MERNKRNSGGPSIPMIVMHVVHVVCFAVFFMSAIAVPFDNAMKSFVYWSAITLGTVVTLSNEMWVITFIYPGSLALAVLSAVSWLFTVVCQLTVAITLSVVAGDCEGNTQCDKSLRWAGNIDPMTYTNNTIATASFVNDECVCDVNSTITGAGEKFGVYGGMSPRWATLLITAWVMVLVYTITWFWSIAFAARSRTSVKYQRQQ